MVKGAFLSFVVFGSHFLGMVLVGCGEFIDVATVYAMRPRENISLGPFRIPNKLAVPSGEGILVFIPCTRCPSQSRQLWHPSPYRLAFEQFFAWAMSCSSVATDSTVYVHVHPSLELFTAWMAGRDMRNSAFCHFFRVP